MGFTTDERMVRVDFFKPSGKWYTTEAVKWTGDYDKGLIHREFAKSLADHLEERETQSSLPPPQHWARIQHGNHRVPSRRLSGMIAVCLEPYHQHSHPIMLKTDEIDEQGGAKRPRVSLDAEGGVSERRIQDTTTRRMVER